MLSPDNPEIDPKRLAEKLDEISVHRRRVVPMNVKAPASLSFAHDLAKDAIESQRSSPVRTWFKETWIGSKMVKVYSRLLQVVRPGLSWRQRIQLVPLFGSIIIWGYAVLNLNKIRQQITSELAELREIQWANQVGLNRRLESLDAINIDYRLNRLDVLDIDNRLNYFDSLDIHNRLQQVEQTLRTQGTGNMERDNRLATLIQELRSRQVFPATVPQSFSVPIDHSATRSGDSDLDRFYVEFEGLFRGARDDIKKRLKVYLPYFTNVAGADNVHVIDIGCGRGEWLELLAEQGIAATGIDLNRAMVDACRDRGLVAQCADAIAYLRRQPAGTIVAVTGFHIIEHLSFETLIALFDAALQALRPNGFIIFETPNPENLAVGACNFYYDPTHQHPIVPVVAEFIARQRGFARAEIVRLHPYPDDHRLPEDNETARRLNKLLYGPQDYAVVAWKQ